MTKFRLYPFAHREASTGLLLAFGSQQELQRGLAQRLNWEILQNHDNVILQNFPRHADELTYNYE